MEIDVSRDRIQELAAQFTPPEGFSPDWDELLDKAEALTPSTSCNGLTIFDLLGPIDGTWLMRLKDFALEEVLPSSGGVPSFLSGIGGEMPDESSDATLEDSLQVLGRLFSGISEVAMADKYLDNCIQAIAPESASYQEAVKKAAERTAEREDEIVAEAEEKEEAAVVGAKEYSVFVCPATGMDSNGIHPLYDCKNEDVFLQPGVCPDCGKDLEGAPVANTDYYLSTYESWA